MNDWKAFNDTLELGLKSSLLSFNEEEWMWLIKCLKLAQQAHDEQTEAELIESYKKGHIEGAIEVVNSTCELCGAYPMTANCNNAGCDK